MFAIESFEKIKVHRRCPMYVMWGLSFLKLKKKFIEIGRNLSFLLNYENRVRT